MKTGAVIAVGAIGAAAALFYLMQSKAVAGQEFPTLQLPSIARITAPTDVVVGGNKTSTPNIGSNTSSGTAAAAGGTSSSSLTASYNSIPITKATLDQIAINSTDVAKAVYAANAVRIANEAERLIGAGCMTGSYFEHLQQSYNTAVAQATGTFYTPAKDSNELESRWAAGTISAGTYWEQKNASSGLSSVSH